MNFIDQVILCLKENSTETITGLILIVLLFLFRKTLFVVQIIVEGMEQAEAKFNSGEGQKKLEEATAYVQSRLPKFLRIFVTKKVIVSIIECFLNVINRIFKTNKVVDIKGNEDNVEENK